MSGSDAVAVLDGSTSSPKAEAIVRLRWIRPHSSSQGRDDGASCPWRSLSLVAPQRFSCLIRPHWQVTVIFDWHGVFSGHGNGA